MHDGEGLNGKEFAFCGRLLKEPLSRTVERGKRGVIDGFFVRGCFHFLGGIGLFGVTRNENASNMETKLHPSAGRQPLIRLKQFKSHFFSYLALGISGYIRAVIRWHQLHALSPSATGHAVSGHYREVNGCAAHPSPVNLRGNDAMPSASFTGPLFVSPARGSPLSPPRAATSQPQDKRFRPPRSPRRATGLFPRRPSR